MASSAGVGQSTNSDSQRAAEEAARSAIEQIDGASPILVMLFHTAKHDPRSCHAAVRSVVGRDCKLIGGYCGGVITRDYLGYDGYQCAVVAIASDTVKFETFIESGLSERGERAVGKALGEQIRSREYDGDPGLVYMYDSVKRFSPSGFDMNVGTYLIEGMGQGLGQWPHAAGMGMIGNIQFNPTFQFFDDQVVQQAAVAVVGHGGGCRLDSMIMHGCKPASDYHTVTKAEENLVLEIDGRPALEVVADMLGPVDKGWEDYPLFVTLGVNKGDKYGEYNEEEYANRLCMAIDRDRRALVMFEPDLTPGTEVQLMRRSVDFDYLRKRAGQLQASLADRKPLLALYIDCMGRAAAYCGSEGEEGEIIRQTIASQMPLLGMYTGVELGKVGSATQQALDWSGVLCVFSEPR